MASRSSPTGSVFLGDIDLTSFGPHYGDLSSSLDDLFTSIGRLRDVEARWYGTSYQVGVLDDPQAFLGALDRFARGGRPQGRDTAAAAAAATDAGLRRHYRLVYRPLVGLPFVEAVERRTALLHLERLARRGLVVPADGGYVAV